MHSRSKFATFNTTINGTSAPETLKTPDLDKVYVFGTAYTKQYGMDAGPGDDRVTGGYSDDEIRGGAGNDIISGSYGLNQLFGGTGYDYVDYTQFALGSTVTEGVNVSLSEGTKLGNGSTRNSKFLILDEFMGFEGVRGSQFKDKIFGNDAGNNRLYGFGGNDQLAGKDGNDYLSGGKGRDNLIGGLGEDKLFGGNNNDRLDGGFGNDLMVGGKGKDILIGQAGDDVLDYNRLSDSTVSRLGRDFVQFKTGEDKFDLRTIDAIKGTAKNDAFDLAGREKAFSGQKGELIYNYFSGLSIDGTKQITNTLLRGDVNGDKKADFSILIEGTRGLTDADFFL